MGSADIVPGVSGGTIALVLGIYTHLIDTVRDGASVLGASVKGDFSGVVERFKAVDWAFLIPLLVGIGVAVIALSHTIEHLLETQPVRMSAAFFGLVIGSIVVTAQRFKPDPVRMATLLGVAIVAFFVLGLRSGTVDDPALPFVFIAGAIAICAMILPGISGSFILVLLGMYKYILSAVSEFQFTVLLVFAAGAAIGLIVFSNLLSWLLHRYHDLTIATLIGVMIGSLNKVWPWKQVMAWELDRHGQPVPALESNVWPWSYPDLPAADLIGGSNEPYLALALALALAGFLAVAAFEWFTRRRLPTTGQAR